MTIIDDQFEEEEVDLSAPDTRAAGRWNSAGVPVERSKDFGNALRRLFLMLRPMWGVLVLVVSVAVVSATLNVLGPKVLGHATNIIVAGLGKPGGIDFSALHHVLFNAILLYVSSAILSISGSARF